MLRLDGALPSRSRRPVKRLLRRAYRCLCSRLPRETIRSSENEICSLLSNIEKIIFITDLRESHGELPAGLCHARESWEEVMGLDIGVVGLGKMGANIALNLLDHGHRVVGYDASQAAVDAAKAADISTAESMAALAQALPQPRVMWVMVPCGAPTDACLTDALKVLEPGDILIDAGTSFYQDSMVHAEQAAKQGVRFLDCGTSGGKSGAREGACLMIGGDRSAFEYLEPVLRGVACEDGCLYTGAAGSGHFMKMVHNGIEYGMMQAIAEGMAVMRASDFEYDLVAVARNWNHGSVIRGWLMELMEQQLKRHPDLADIKGVVAASGEAKWTVHTALEMEVPVPVIALSLMARNASQEEDSFACKALAALRNGFGGHDFVSCTPEGCDATASVLGQGA